MSIGRRNLLAATTSIAAVPLILKTISSNEARAAALLPPPPNQAVFDTAWLAFNNRDWPTLATCLADKVRLFRVNNTGSLFGSKKKIINYFKGMVSDEYEMFTPDPAQENWTANGKLISGYATWQDNDNPAGNPTSSTISYFFRFTDSPGLIDRMFGSKD
jgi:hypothetical protein